MRNRDLLILIGAFALALVLGLWIFFGGAIQTGNWGLSFRQEGAPPLGPASSEQLKKYDAVYLGDTSKKVIYLTFDAGYENGNTAKNSGYIESTQRPRGLFSGGQLH